MISSVLRRSATALLVVAVLGATTVLTAGAAVADTPEPRPGGWEPKPEIDVLEAWLLLGGVPLLVLVVITAMFVGPALARGESLHPTKREPASQWIGGPRKSAGELAEPDGEGSAAGGAGGSW